MKTLMVNVPQALRAKLQAYQNDNKIAEPTTAIVTILDTYLETWTPSQKTDPLPAMYDAEDGPCEVLPSFLES